jgi:hypothetical protein
LAAETAFVAAQLKTSVRRRWRKYESLMTWREKEKEQIQ